MKLFQGYRAVETEESDGEEEENVVEEIFKVVRKAKDRDIPIRKMIQEIEKMVGRWKEKEGEEDPWMKETGDPWKRGSGKGAGQKTIGKGKGKTEGKRKDGKDEEGRPYGKGTVKTG